MSHNPPKTRLLSFVVATSLAAGVVAGCSLAGKPLPTDPLTPEDRLVHASRTGSEASQRAAKRRLERFRFVRARRLGGVLAWRRFLRHHPNGLFGEQARADLALARYRLVRRANTAAAYRGFLKDHGDHRLGVEAWRRLTSRLAATVIQAKDQLAIRVFLKRYPKSPQVAVLRRKLEELDFRSLGPHATLQALETFGLRYPTSTRRAAIRKRIAIRLAERIAHFGDERDLAGYLRRFPTGDITEGLRARVLAKQLRNHVLALNGRGLRQLETRRIPDRPGRVRLRTWIQRNPAHARQVREAIRKGLVWRPTARPTALAAAAGVSDPRTAVYAIRALAYIPTLGALDAILRGVGSTDSAVSSFAVDALARWALLHRRAPARRLLADRASVIRSRRNAAARLTEAALRRTLGEWPRLLTILAGRSWHRPWNVVPHYLWLETLPAKGAAGESKPGRRTLRAYNDEHRKLSQMLPAQVRQSNRSRAEAAVFELDRLAHTASRLVAKHGSTGGKWVRKLRLLASRCRRQRDLGDRQLGGFPGYRTVLVDRLDEQRRAHRAGLGAARIQLVRILRRIRPPGLVGATLCALAKAPGKSLILPCKNGHPIGP
jgi:hypothetical protein